MGIMGLKVGTELCTVKLWIAASDTLNMVHKNWIKECLLLIIKFLFLEFWIEKVNTKKRSSDKRSKEIKIQCTMTTWYLLRWSQVLQNMLFLQRVLVLKWLILVLTLEVNTKVLRGLVLETYRLRLIQRIIVESSISFRRRLRKLRDV